MQGIHRENNGTVNHSQRGCCKDLGKTSLGNHRIRKTYSRNSAIHIMHDIYYCQAKNFQGWHTNTKQKQRRIKVGFSRHYIPFIFPGVADRYKVILFQAVSSKLTEAFPEQSCFPFWQLTSTVHQVYSCLPIKETSNLKQLASERLIFEAKW